MSKELKHRVLLCQFLKRKNSLSTTANSSSKKSNSPVSMTEPERGFQNITASQIQQSTSINKFMRFSKVRTYVLLYVCVCCTVMYVEVYVLYLPCTYYNIDMCKYRIKYHIICMYEIIQIVL